MTTCSTGLFPRFLLLTFLISSVSETLSAQDVVYDHAAECIIPRTPAKIQSDKQGIRIDPPVGCRREFSIWLEPGEPFEILIRNTFPSDYSYEIAGLEVVEVERKLSPEEQDALISALEVEPNSNSGPEAEDRAIRYTHDSRFGGYILDIKPVSSPTENLGVQPPATIIVQVRQPGWQLSFDGGFTGSTLTDPVYEVRDGQLYENDDKQSDVVIGAAAFVTIWHNRTLSWGGITTGIGIDKGAALRYYIGPSVRLGNKAIVTFGLVAGPVDIPPPGLSVGDPVTDSNALSNMGSKTDFGVFLALAYRFLGSKDAINKAYAGGGQPSSQ